VDDPDPYTFRKYGAPCAPRLGWWPTSGPSWPPRRKRSRRSGASRKASEHTSSSRSIGSAASRGGVCSRGPGWSFVAAAALRTVPRAWERDPSALLLIPDQTRRLHTVGCHLAEANGGAVRKRSRLRPVARSSGRTPPCQVGL